MLKKAITAAAVCAVLVGCTAKPINSSKSSARTDSLRKTEFVLIPKTKMTEKMQNHDKINLEAVEKKAADKVEYEFQITEELPETETEKVIR